MSWDVQVELTGEQAKRAAAFVNSLNLDNRVIAQFTDGHTEDITDNPKYAYIVDKVLKRNVPQIKSLSVIKK